MRIETLFFAHYREIVGQGRLEMHLDEGARAAELVQALRERGHPFDRLPESPTVAVNECYVSLDTPLRADDVVALLPPVAGG